MNWFPLPIFPEGSLATSVVTTVWVGVFVFCFMNLRFGWVFSGLVVPGYLVPLIIMKPWGAAVVVVEAVLTFWTVWVLTRLMPRFGVACSFFGRDRFMAMIIISALYRVVADVWLLPLVGEYLATAHGLDFDYKNNLASFGLIVICLAANQLWKTGVLRGALPFVFNIGVTYLLVRYVLMECTNFSISNLGYLYEGIASSIYAAPKAYIVLITTAVLASRMNLLYGWDFHGIMIPALIALQWYEPLKVLTSFVEALVVLGGAVLALKLPMFKSATIEGARKLLFFFTISFLYKMAVGWGMLFVAPELKVSDFYGFGYLLPTLMAIKMHQIGKVGHQLRITAQISVVSVVIANAIGFALTFLPTSLPSSESGVRGVALNRYESSELESVVRRAFVSNHASAGADATAPGPEELYRFETGLDLLTRGSGMPRPTIFELGQGELSAAGFKLEVIGDSHLLISPKDPASGRPIICLNTRTESELVVECPFPFDERDSFEAGYAIFKEHSARALAIAGVGGAWDRGSFGDYGIANTWMARFHRQALGSEFIQVRDVGDVDGNQLFVKRRLPDGLGLKLLEKQFGPFEAIWEAPDEVNAFREITRSEFCELFVGKAASIPGTPPVQFEDLGQPIDGLIREAMHDFAPKGSLAYRVPSKAELLHLDRYVLRPLFGLREGSDFERNLGRVARNASFYGYAVRAYRSDHVSYVLLSECGDERNWGSVLVRLDSGEGLGRSLCFQVPSRIKDRTLLSFAATQFKRLGADAMIVSGTNGMTNVDGSTDLTSLTNGTSFFNLAHEAFLRDNQSRDRSSIVLQCGAFLPDSGEPYPAGDLIVAPYFENRSENSIRELLEDVIRLLEGDGIKTVQVVEDAGSSPYSVGFNRQARYLDFSGDSTFAVFWLSSFLRENYVSQGDNVPLINALRVVGLEVESVPLNQVLTSGSLVDAGETNAALKPQIKRLRERMDVRALARLKEDLPELEFRPVLDPPSRQIFLVCNDTNGGTLLVANLSRSAFERSVGREFGVEAFIDSRAAWFEQLPIEK